MRKDWRHLDRFRSHADPNYDSPSGATYGAFEISFGGVLLRVIATDGKISPTHDTEWEHVSVHAFDPFFKNERIPRWPEMAFVKDLFFEESEAVMELHVPKTDHININPYVLHLWRPTKYSIPLPPKLLV